MVMTSFTNPLELQNLQQLELPQYDETIPSLSGDGDFVSNNRFFDFSGVDMSTLENFETLSDNAHVCKPEVTDEGIKAFFLIGEWSTAHRFAVTTSEKSGPATSGTKLYLRSYMVTKQYIPTGVNSVLHLAKF